MKKYSHLLFDADNTLLDFSKSEQIAITEVFDKYNVSLENVELFSRLNDRAWKEYEKGSVSRSELRISRFQSLISHINRFDLDPKVLDSEYFEAMSNTSINVPGSIELCKKCAEMGYKLYIITNGSAYTQNKRINSNVINKYITKAYISEEIGLSKPNKDFFDYVLKDIKASSSDCLIIGDSLTSDIQGGINSSIDTCWYNPLNTEPKGIAPTYTISDLKQLIHIL